MRVSYLISFFLFVLGSFAHAAPGSEAPDNWNLCAQAIQVAAFDSSAIRTAISDPQLDVAKFKAVLQHAPPDLHWFRYHEVMLAPHRYSELVGMTIAGYANYWAGGDDYRFRFHFGKIASIAHKANGEVWITLDDGSEFGLNETHSDYCPAEFFFLGPHTDDAQVLTNTLIHMGLPEALRTGQDRSLISEDFEVLRVMFTLFYGLPPSHGRTSVVNVLLAKSEFMKSNPKVYGFVSRWTHLKKRYSRSRLSAVAERVENILNEVAWAGRVQDFEPRSKPRSGKAVEDIGYDERQPYWIPNRSRYLHSAETWIEAIDAMGERLGVPKFELTEGEAATRPTSPAEFRKFAVAGVASVALYERIATIAAELKRTYPKSSFSINQATLLEDGFAPVPGARPKVDRATGNRTSRYVASLFQFRLDRPAGRGKIHRQYLEIQFQITQNAKGEVLDVTPLWKRSAHTRPTKTDYRTELDPWTESELDAPYLIPANGYSLSDLSPLVALMEN